MNELMLEGCRAEPLASYLKSIGLLRLVGEQVDPETRGHWVGDTFCLTTSLTMDELVSFLVDRYVPTPVITPWNKGSGFATDDATKSKTAFANVEAIRSSSDGRLGAYRRSIEIAVELAERKDWLDLDKQTQVSLCRSNLPDTALDWLDAAVVLTSESRVFPPLLGTGGNDGRLDFGSNFMQRVTDVLGIGLAPRSREDRLSLIAEAITGRGHARLDNAAIGQFDPAAAGGPGSSPAGAANSLSNPWDFVLLFEGAMVFASGVARRLGAARNASAIPFMVKASFVGYASSASEGGRGEFWAPLWRSPATNPEVARFVGEGRIEFNGRQARNGLDVVRALSSLGVDRGIDQFVRYAFLERNGLATFCVPTGRLLVRPRQGVSLLSQVDPWLDRVRRASNLPASASDQLRQIDSRQFSISQHGDSSELQRLLVDLSRLESLASRGAGLREATSRWVTGVRAKDWLAFLDDGSVEFEIAVAFASLRSPGDKWGWLRPLFTDETWKGRKVAVYGLGQRPFDAVMADALEQLSIRHRERAREDKADVGCFGSSTAVWASAGALAALSIGACDDSKIADLVGALLLLDWRGSTWLPTVVREPIPLARAPVALAMLKPLFHHRSLASVVPRGQPLRASPDVARLLSTRQLSRAIESAHRSLRIAGFDLLVADALPNALDVSAARIATACLLPVSDSTVTNLLNRIAENADTKHKENQS